MDDKPDISGPISGKAINGLVLNLLLPGLGSLYVGRSDVGTKQLALFGGGVFCFLLGFLVHVLFFVAPLLLIGAWLWSLIVGVQIYTEGNSA